MKAKRSWFFKIIFFTIVIILGVVTAFLWKTQTVYNKVFTDKETGFLNKLHNTASGGLGLTKLSGESKGQVNVLLLGIGGANHDGGYLTDSIILAQINTKTKQVSLTHIPRDLYVYIEKVQYKDKINAAFAHGFQPKKDFADAGASSIKAVEKITGLQIPYFAVIDFSGFKKAIDSIGGVDVVIDRTFTDYMYPDEKLGYTAPITFKAGNAHMDGKTALIFARSRHGNNNEGSDFARGLRQQKVILAVKDKLITANLLKGINNLNELLDVAADHFHTNLTPGEVMRLFNIVKDYEKNNIASQTLDGSTGLICDSTVEETGAYILTLCDGITDIDLQNYFKKAFTLGGAAAERSKILILSDSINNTEYLKLTKQLKEAGITAAYKKYKLLPKDENVFYQVNDKPKTVKLLKNTLNLFQVFTLPSDIKYQESTFDLIILTKESDE